VKVVVPEVLVVRWEVVGVVVVNVVVPEVLVVVCVVVGLVVT
jgi:hypothetical protein